ncbi:hypothetical protein CKAH01_02031 [Colletotrichum kahawae]|uniref:Uncharacterized protein n=1 Tax=Colletotrichum kahawae TaxID=34407 RepID=A0AAD9Y1S4_COLKA|nr:hypothetical protein CKAH01_02031 [Colletotrichum kahawae]
MRRRPLHCVCVPLESGATDQAPYSPALQLSISTGTPHTSDARHPSPMCRLAQITCR